MQNGLFITLKVPLILVSSTVEVQIRWSSSLTPTGQVIVMIKSMLGKHSFHWKGRSIEYKHT